MGIRFEPFDFVISIIGQQRKQHYLKRIILQGLSDSNETESLLQWMPMKEHNEKVLTCRAEHPNFNRSSIESILKLNVYCKYVF